MDGELHVRPLVEGLAVFHPGADVDRPAEKVGHAANATQVTAGGEEVVGAALFADAERAKSKRSAKRELLGGKWVAVEGMAGAAGDEQARLTAAAERVHVLSVHVHLRDLLARHDSAFAAGDFRRVQVVARRGRPEDSARGDDRAVLGIVRPAQSGHVLLSLQRRQIRVPNPHRRAESRPIQPEANIVETADVDSNVGPER